MVQQGGFTLYNPDNFQNLLFFLRRAGSQFFQDFTVNGIRNGIFVFENIVNGQIQYVADGNQSSERYLYPVIFYVADVRNIYADLFGNVFLGIVLFNTAGADGLADFFKF